MPRSGKNNLDVVYEEKASSDERRTKDSKRGPALAVTLPYPLTREASNGAYLENGRAFGRRWTRMEAFARWMPRSRWVQVFACSLIFMNNWGLASSSGIYQAYYQSSTVSPSLSGQGHSPFAISWIGTTQASLTLLVGILSGPLFDRGCFYTVIIPASLLLSSSFMVLSVSTKYWHVLLVQGIIQGICSGALYIPSVSIIPRHFADSKRGTALGLVTAGAPVGGIVYPIVFRILLERRGFAWATRLMGFIVFGSLGTACLLVRPTKTAEGRANKSLARSSLIATLKDPSYLSFLAAAFLLFCAMLIPYMFCATYSVTVIDRVPAMMFYVGQNAGTVEPSLTDEDGSFLAIRDRAFYTVIILNGANFFGRTFLAILSDLGLPAEIMLGISTLVMGILGFSWILVTTRAPYIVFLVLYGFSSGILSTLPPILLGQMWPDQSIFATLLGIVYVSAGFGVLVGTPIAASLNNYSPDSHPYLASQIWTGGCMMLGTVFVTYCGRRIRKIRQATSCLVIRLNPILTPTSLND